MIDPNVAAKIAQIVLGSNNRDEIVKEAFKGSSGMSRALKLTGLAGGVGAAGAGTYHAGKSSGNKSGMETGAKQQFTKDQESFKQIAPKIFNAGRITQARQDKAMFKNYLSKNNPGTAGTSKSNGKYSKMSHGTSHTKTGMEMAEAVVDGWVTGQVKTASIQTLPGNDLQKVAMVLVDRMNTGDEIAGMLWRALSS